MKIALITDTHLGIRGNSEKLFDLNRKFLNNVFFPEIDSRKIDRIVHLGDFVDSRTQLHFKTANHLKKDWLEPILNRGIQFDWILGNHDIYYRQSNELSVADEIYDPYRSTKLFAFYKDPTELFFDKTKILFIPWVCESNEEQTARLIKETNAQIALGHLELQGFEMFRGMVATHGEDPSVYAKFDFVGSGHYHHKSSHNGIHMLGSHAQFIWSDHSDDRGFHLLDTNDRSLEFIRNPYDLFAKVFYDDTQEFNEDSFKRLTDRYVKVIVRQKNNNDRYEWFLNRVEEASPIEYTIVNDHLNMDLIDDGEIVSDAKDTLTLLREHARSVNNAVNSTKLDSLLTDLYKQAHQIES